MLLSNILEKYQPDISAERSSWNRHSLLFAYLNEYFYAFPHDEQKKFNFHLFYLSKYLFFFEIQFRIRFEYFSNFIDLLSSWNELQFQRNRPRLGLFLIQVCLKIRTREEVGITDRLSTRMELASIEVRNHPFSCLPHFNAVLTATFHDSSLLSPNRSRNSLSRRRFSRSYLFEGKN